MEERKPSHLRLVSVQAPDKRSRPSQTAMFLSCGDNVLCILDTSKIEAGRFEWLIEEMKPRWVIDLRPVPRFDFDHLNRKSVFDLFLRNKCEYKDAAGLLGLKSRLDSSISSGVAAEFISRLVTNSGSKRSGPLAVLLEDASLVELCSRILPGMLETKGKSWEVMVM